MMACSTSATTSRTGLEASTTWQLGDFRAELPQLLDDGGQVSSLRGLVPLGPPFRWRRGPVGERRQPDIGDELHRSPIKGIEDVFGAPEVE